MKAKIVGMSALQGTPSGGTLAVYPDERFEDGNGNATVGRLDYVLDVPTLTWRDAHNPAADAYLVVSAPGEPYPITAMFEESILYAARPPVKQNYRRYLQASDLYATEFSYTERQNVRLYNTNEPITMQAARQVIGMKAGIDKALADTEQSTANQITQQQANNAQAAGILGRLSAPSVAAIGAAAGVYNITAGPEAGQVWQRGALGAAPTRQFALEALSRAAADLERGLSVDSLASIATLSTELTSRGQVLANLAAKNYVLNAQVDITRASFALIGQGMATWIGETEGNGTLITVPQAVTTAFRLTGKVKSAVSQVGSARIQGFTAIGAGYSKGQTFLAFEYGGGPGSPIAIRDVRIERFDKAISSRVPAGMSTGAFLWNMRSAVLYANKWGIYGYNDTGEGVIGSLSVQDSVIKSNASGGIYIPEIVGGAGAYYGPGVISNVLMEDQIDPITIYGGLAHIVMGSNYFELSKGAIFYKFSRAESSVEIAPQYIHNSPELYGDLNTGTYRISDRIVPWRFTNSTVDQFEGSFVGLKPMAAAAITMAAFAPHIFQSKAAPAGAISAGNTDGTYTPTSTGLQKLKQITTLSSQIQATGLTVKPGTAITATLYIENRTAAAIYLGGQWLTSASVIMAELGPAIAIEPGRGRVVVAHLIGADAQYDNPKFRLLAGTTGLHMSPVTFYNTTVAQTSGTAAQQAQAKVPLYIMPGKTVIPQVNIPDLTAPPTQADLNALLARLRAAGVLE